MAMGFRIRSDRQTRVWTTCTHPAVEGREEEWQGI